MRSLFFAFVVLISGLTFDVSAQLDSFVLKYYVNQSGGGNLAGDTVNVRYNFIVVNIPDGSYYVHDMGWVSNGISAPTNPINGSLFITVSGGKITNTGLGWGALTDINGYWAKPYTSKYYASTDGVQQGHVFSSLRLGTARSSTEYKALVPTGFRASRVTVPIPWTANPPKVDYQEVYNVYLGDVPTVDALFAYGIVNNSASSRTFRLWIDTVQKHEVVAAGGQTTTDVYTHKVPPATGGEYKWEVYNPATEQWVLMLEDTYLAPFDGTEGTNPNPFAVTVAPDPDPEPEPEPEPTPTPSPGEPGGAPGPPELPPRDPVTSPTMPKPIVNVPGSPEDVTDIPTVVDEVMQGFASGLERVSGDGKGGGGHVGPDGLEGLPGRGAAQTVGNEPPSGGSFWVISFPIGNKTYTLNLDPSSHPQIAEGCAWVRRVLAALAYLLFLGWLYGKEQELISLAGTANQIVVAPPDTTPIFGAAVKAAIWAALMTIVLTFVLSLPVQMKIFYDIMGLDTTGLSTAVGLGGGSGLGTIAYHALQLCCLVLPVSQLVIIAVNWLYVQLLGKLIASVIVGFFRALPS